MITKQQRNGKDGQYDLKIIDKNGNSFIMTVGENYDLYWIPQGDKRTFEIGESGEITFTVFEKLVEAVRSHDDKFKPALVGNTLTYISEDCPEDEANVLKIVKTKERGAYNWQWQVLSIFGRKNRGWAV